MQTNPQTGFSLKLKLLTLAAVALVLAIFFAIPSKTKNLASTMEEVNFGIQDTTNISRLVIGDVVITKNNTSWLMSAPSTQSFVVDDEMIASFWAIMQRLEVKRPASESIKEQVINSFMTEGIKIEVFANTNQIRNFSISEYEGETYAMQAESSQPYAVYIPGYYVKIAEVLDIRPFEWKDRTLISTTPNTFRNLELRYSQNTSQSFVLEFSGKTFGIKDFPQADTTKVYDYLPYFSQIKAEQFLQNEQLKDSLLTTKPFVEIRLDDVQKGQQELQLYTARNRYFGIYQNQLVLFPSSLAARILVTKSDFLSDK